MSHSLATLRIFEKFFADGAYGRARDDPTHSSSLGTAGSPEPHDDDCKERERQEDRESRIKLGIEQEHERGQDERRDRNELHD